MAPTDRLGDGRRPAAVALTVAGLAVVAAALVALVLGLTGGDDEDPPPAPRAVSATVAVDDASFGVRLRHPRGWTRAGDRRAIRLASPDRRLGLSITTVASRPAVARIAGAVERGVLRTLRRGVVLRRFGGRIGGRPARLSAIRARNARDEQLDVLLGVVASRWRTYAVVTFGSAGASQAVLRQGESILASLQFRRPGR